MEVITDTIADKAYMSGYDEGYAAGIRRTLEATAKKLSQEFRVVTAKRILIDIIHDLGYTVNDSGRDMIRVFTETDPETGFAPLLTVIKFGESHE